MTQNTRKPVALVLGTALTGGMLLGANAFAMNELPGGYMQDAGSASMQETTDAKATEGNCGAKADAKTKTEGKCGAKNEDAKFAMMDTNQDGKVSKEEFAAQHDGNTDHFAAHDGNGDGVMTQAEMKQAHAKMHAEDNADTGKNAAAEEKGMMEGKCGEGKCGGSL